MLEVKFDHSHSHTKLMGVQTITNPRFHGFIKLSRKARHSHLSVDFVYNKSFYQVSQLHFMCEFA